MIAIFMRGGTGQGLKIRTTNNDTLKEPSEKLQILTPKLQGLIQLFPNAHRVCEIFFIFFMQHLG